MILLASPFGDGAQSLEIGLFMADNADQIDLSELLRQRCQGRRRDLDGVIIGLLPLRERFQDPPRLFSLAAAELRHLNWRGQPAHNFSRILFPPSRLLP